MTEFKRAEDFRRSGLDDGEVTASAARFGRNVLSKQKGKSFWRRFLGNLNDPVIRILLGALAVNLVLAVRGADWVETVGIAIAVFLAAFISTLSECSSERAFEELSREGERVVCRVRRGGHVREIPMEDVVVGDIVLLSAGELIPADGVIMAGALASDQSAMTGENREVSKLPSDNDSRDPASPSALFRGCTVTAGGGEMGVTSVGDNTFLGQISREVQMERRDSPLKIRLAKLAKQISVLGYIAAVLVALAYLFHVFLLDSGMRWEVIRLKLLDAPYLISKLFHAFTLGLTVIVVAVPEGLPMMIAVVLSGNIRRMVRDNVLVRKPVGIEAAGSMNLLFTDKTGTLTEGRMKLTEVLAADGGVCASAESILARERFFADLISLGLRGGEAILDESGRAIGGNATERALLEGISALPQPDGYRVFSKLRFESERKYASVSYKGKSSLTFLLGAPEKLLPFVHGAIYPDGRMGEYSKKNIERALLERTKKGYRCLLLALSAEDIPATSHREGIRGSLVLVSVLCLSDPVRVEAPGAVEDLHRAGIQVVMITGDSKETASAIAQTCGIQTKKTPVVLTGEEMARLSDVQLKEILPRLSVVARALPTDKSRLVRLSQEMGLVAGMTGDGINDAPALRRADIGFAMGGGTQVAKDAGDIVILDNNLSSIVRAVLYGRSIFKSIRKFIALQLTMNFSAVGVTMICPFLGIDSPVTVVQMLWINLIMDTLGGLAFAGEAPLAEYMREKPKRRETGILNGYMIDEIAVLGGFTVALCLTFLKCPLITSQFRHHEKNLYLLTAFFALFIFASVFNCFNARTDRLRLSAGLRQNPVFIGIMLAVLAIQILFVYIGGSVLRTLPLTARELGVTMLMASLVFPFDLLRKWIWRKIKGKKGY